MDFQISQSQGNILFKKKNLLELPTAGQRLLVNIQYIREKN